MRTVLERQNMTFIPLMFQHDAAWWRVNAKTGMAGRANSLEPC